MYFQNIIQIPIQYLIYQHIESISEFLATLVALHLNPVGKWVGEWVVVSN